MKLIALCIFAAIMITTCSIRKFEDVQAEGWLSPRGSAILEANKRYLERNQNMQNAIDKAQDKLRRTK